MWQHQNYISGSHLIVMVLRASDFLLHHCFHLYNCRKEEHWNDLACKELNTIRKSQFCEWKSHQVVRGIRHHKYASNHQEKKEVLERKKMHILFQKGNDNVSRKENWLWDSHGLMLLYACCMSFREDSTGPSSVWTSDGSIIIRSWWSPDFRVPVLKSCAPLWPLTWNVCHFTLTPSWNFNYGNVRCMQTSFSHQKIVRT